MDCHRLMTTFETSRYCHCMSPRADEYRRKAREAEAMAEAARDQTAKETLLEVAERWHKLADQAERNGW
jgi:hypothetical protein